MTRNQMSTMQMMSRHTSASSADAAGFCAYCAAMYSNRIAIFVDAIFVASIIIIAALANPAILGVFLVLLVLLVGLMACKAMNTPTTRRCA